MTHEEMDDWVRESKYFFDFIARGFYDLTVRGYITNEQIDYAADQWGKRIIAEASQQEGYVTPDFHMVIGGSHPARCGEARLGGIWGRVFSESPTGQCKIRTLVHEHVHQLGLRHSGTIDRVTGELKLYGDASCLMGTGAGFYGLSAPKIKQLGWYDPREELVIRSEPHSEFVRLVPLELFKQDLVDGEYTFAYIPHESVTISTRKSRCNFPLVRGHKAADTVYVHYIDKATGFSHRYGGDLTPGSSLQLKRGTMVEYIDWNSNNESARVAVSVPSKV